jgi:hypothetical protein
MRFSLRLAMMALPIVSLAGCNSTTTAWVERTPHQQFSWDGAGIDPNEPVRQTPPRRKRETSEQASAGTSEDIVAKRTIICRGCQFEPDQGRQANASVVSTIDDGQDRADRSDGRTPR